MDKFPADFCKQILVCDKTIRFSGITDRFGKIIMMEYRKGIAPLLSREEAVLSAILSSIRMGTRKTLQPKLGKVVCSFTVYEKVVLATLPLDSNSSLMVSFDLDGNHESIILKKILPLVKK